MMKTYLHVHFSANSVKEAVDVLTEITQRVAKELDKDWESCDFIYSYDKRYIDNSEDYQGD